VDQEDSRSCEVTLCDEDGSAAGEVRLHRSKDGKVHFETERLVPVRALDGARTLLVAEEEVPSLLWVLKAEPTARFREAVTWRVMAELARRHPGHVSVREMHGGGGQYDELRLYPRPAPEGCSFFISLNLQGSAHFGRVEQEPWRSFWSDYVGAEDPKDIVDELERRSGLMSAGGHVSESSLPASTPDVLTIRAIASLLAPTAFERERWSCVSGYLDTSGYGGGLRRELFEAFPLSKARLCEHLDDDMLGEAAYRFWFILRGGEPRLAFEETGLVWDRHDEQLNLVARRKAVGSLARVVPELARRL